MTERLNMPADVIAPFNGGVMTRSNLDKANAWVIGQLLEGRPDLNRWETEPWERAMEMLERRIQQGYRSLGESEKEAEAGPATQKWKNPKARKVRTFNDNADAEFKGPCKTLGELVLVHCGEDTPQMEKYLNLKAMFSGLEVAGDDCGNA